MVVDLTMDEMQDVLRGNAVGHLACHTQGELYLTPVTYLYGDNAIYSYTYDGKKVDMLRSDPNACFQVEEIVSPYSWRSVIVWGIYEELTGNERMERLARLSEHTLSAQSAGKPVYVPFRSSAEVMQLSAEDRVPVVYRIVITKQTGRMEKEG